MEFLKYVSRHPNYWGAKEVFVTNYSRSLSGNGFIDILLKVNDQYEVYEIKPIYYHNWVDDEKSGKAQREAYIKALENGGYKGMEVNVNENGITFNPNGWRVPSNVKGYDFMYVTYPDSPGMIYYKYVKRKGHKEPVPSLQKEISTNEIKEVAEDVVIGVGTTAILYGVYRFVRMLPSLLPPLWFTIPANAACP